MKKTPAIFFLGLAALLPTHAADSGKGLQDFQDERMFGQSIPNHPAKGAARAPTPDARRIINQSSSFLKEREPEMTEEEGAIYEKLSGMLANNVDLAVKMLQGMVNEKVPPSPAFDFILGNAYYTSNQLDRAEELYLRAVKRYPSFLRAWNNLGIAYYTQNRFSEASPCFAKAVSLGDRDPVMLGLLGYSLEAQGDFVAAETAYLQAVAGDPENVDSKTGLLRIFVAGRQYARAEPVARFLVKAKPTETHCWLDYAGILLAQGRKVEAMVVLEEADDSGVAGPDEWELLGDLLAEQSLAPEAVKVYQKLSSAAPQRGERKLLQFARVLVAAGRLEEAGRALSAVPDNLTPSTRIEWLRTRADLLLAQKRWAEARKEIEALLALEPLDGRSMLSLGRTYREEGNAPRAMLAYEAAGRSPETAYEASVELANIEIQNRHFAKSVDYLERALSIQKTDVIEDALARVKSLVSRETNPN